MTKGSDRSGRDAAAKTKARSFRPALGRDPAEVPCLSVVTGESRGRVVVLPVGTSHIGRAPTAHLQLLDDGVSRTHARVELSTDGIVTVRDLGSTNGTYVNGARSERALVREGDRIQIGPNVTVRFGYRTRAELTGGHAAAAPPSAIPLTERELEVARLAASGLTNADIGARLCISAGTVKTHMRNVYERLDVHSRVTLAEDLRARGLLGTRRS